jgi:hypothetical protein
VDQRFPVVSNDVTNVIDVSIIGRQGPHIILGDLLELTPPVDLKEYLCALESGQDTEPSGNTMLPS